MLSKMSKIDKLLFYYLFVTLFFLILFGFIIGVSCIESFKSKNRFAINISGQSLRNANMQLRSEPPNPIKKVGPWMQSTIEPDLYRKQLL
jgi:hypothetical protein|tara:strand:- start:224 stop:493 length:270 start_codon:yes stop_codon:yes gene_type:complete